MDLAFERLFTEDGFDLGAVEQFIRELDRLNWKTSLDGIDLSPLLELVSERKKRLVLLEAKLVQGLKKVGVNRGRLRTRDREELIRVSQQASKIQEDVSRTALWDLVENFEERWSLKGFSPGSPFYCLNFKEPFHFTSPISVKAAEINHRKLLEDLFENSLPHIEDHSLQEDINFALKISQKGKPGPGRYNQKIRKQLNRDQEILPINQNTLFPLRSNPLAELCCSAWYLTTKDPVPALETFPWCSVETKKEPFPGSCRIFLQHLTGQVEL